MRNFLFPRVLRLPLFDVADEGAGGGDAAAAAAANPPGKWFEGESYSAEEREWLSAKGLAVDDPSEVLPKLVKGHRSAEQRIGKGLDSIMDRPAKDQPYAEWAKANGAALGLPETADGYTAAPPEDWPKDLPWDSNLEARARQLAFDMGAPPEVHKAYVALFAEHVKGLETASAEGLAKAKTDLMTELTRDFGDEVHAVTARAKQGAALLAEKAGLSAEGLDGVSQLLSEKVGDARVIRLFNAVGELAGEDALLGRGSGGMMSAADAKAEFSKMHSPGGEYYEAVATNDRAAQARLKVRIDQLAKVMARG